MDSSRGLTIDKAANNFLFYPSAPARNYLGTEIVYKNEFSCMK